jgi:hypothetical protein
MSALGAEAGIKKHPQSDVCFGPSHTAVVYQVVRNLGRIAKLQIRSRRRVARPRHVGHPPKDPADHLAEGRHRRRAAISRRSPPAVDAHRIIRDRRPQRQTRQFLKPFGGTASRPTWRQLDWDMLRGGRHNWASISGSVALERFQNEKKLLSKHGRNPRCGRFSICRNGLLGIQSPVRDRST